MLDQRDYAYDAFVIYSQQDSHWVIHELRPRLELEDNLRLCIHHRDWLCGRDIVDNIAESIESSRKCLMIVSNAFVTSNWCHLEMTMAQTKQIHEDRKNLIVVLMEELSECNTSSRLRLQMERETYVEWTEDLAGQQLFWARLRLALRRPNQSIVHIVPPPSLCTERYSHNGDGITDMDL